MDLPAAALAAQSDAAVSPLHRHHERPQQLGTGALRLLPEDLLQPPRVGGGGPGTAPPRSPLPTARGDAPSAAGRIRPPASR